MSQNPYTPSETSYDETDPTMSTTPSAYDEQTSVTSVPPTGTGSPSVTGTAGTTGTTGAAGTTGWSTSSTGASTSGYGQSGSVRDEAASVTSDAAESGRQVAGTAVSEAKDVAGEARSQIMGLMHQLRSEANDQAAGQSDRAVQGLRGLGDELRQMASSSGQNGLATDLAGQAADRVHSVAGWLEQRQPGEVLDEVRDFARRRPGTFLAAAAVVGLIGGRLTRGLTAGSSSSSSTGSSRAALSGTGTTGLGYAAPVSTTSTYGADPVAYTEPRSTYGTEGFEGSQGGAGAYDVGGVGDLQGMEGVDDGVEGAEYRQGLR
jgi:hypothetical protein